MHIGIGCQSEMHVYESVPSACPASAHHGAPPIQVRNFVDKHFDLAVYDPPTKLTSRRNEVIFEAGSGLIPDNPFMSIPDGFLARLRAVYAELFH